MLKEWYEILPDSCPPIDADGVNGTYYRFLSGKMPVESDFVSQRQSNPIKKFKGVDECVARSLSVFDSLEVAKNKKKLPKFRNSFICKVNLRPEDGVVKKTFGLGHYSWWRSISFDISKVEVLL